MSGDPLGPGVIVQHCNPRTEYELIRHPYDPDGCPHCAELRELATERRCPACRSPRWVSVSFDGGWTRRAQCVPCGKVHADPLGPGWRAQ